MASDRVLQIVIKAKNEASKVLKGAGADVEDWASSTQKAGAVLTGVGIASALALNKMADGTADYGKRVLLLQRLTGGSAEDSSRLAAMFDRLGIESSGAARLVKSLDTAIVNNNKTTVNAGKVMLAQIALKKLEVKYTLARTKAAKDSLALDIKAAKIKVQIAKEGKKSTSALFEMGIATVDTTGKTRKFTDVLGDVAEYFTKTKDKTKAVALVTKVLGKNYKDLMPILNNGKKGFEEAMKTADKFGLTMSGKNLDDIKSYNKAMKDNEQSAKGLAFQMGMAVIPIKTLVEQKLGQLLQWFNKLDPQTKGLATQTILLGTGFLLVAGPVLTLVGSLPAIIAGFSSLVGILSGPAGLVALAGAAGFAIGSLINQLQVVKDMQKDIGTWLQQNTGLGGSGAGTAELGTAMTSKGYYLNSDGTIAHHASGGFFARPHKAVVGDSKGGEWWVPNNSGGMGVLAAANAAMGGGGSQSIHVYLDGRELSRALGKTVSHTARSGAR